MSRAMSDALAAQRVKLARQREQVAELRRGPAVCAWCGEGVATAGPLHMASSAISADEAVCRQCWIDNTDPAIARAFADLPKVFPVEDER